MQEDPAHVPGSDAVVVGLKVDTLKPELSPVSPRDGATINHEPHGISDHPGFVARVLFQQPLKRDVHLMRTAHAKATPAKCMQ